MFVWFDYYTHLLFHMCNCIEFYKMYTFMHFTIKINVKVTFWHIRSITI